MARLAGEDGIAVLASLGAYRGIVLPAVRGELERWRPLAAAIPDPALRGCAEAGLTAKAANPEATGVLATLAPRRTRRAVIHASTALQVAIDYLDGLGEQPTPDPLADGLRLHGALGAALTPGAPAEDWYQHHPNREDGGYLEALTAACREGIRALPSGDPVLPLARRAAERCGAGQSHTHAAVSGSPGDLEKWALGEGAPAGFAWWEVAAGGSSSVAAHALLALAGQPDASAAEAEALDAAYFPAIGALTVLLDDLVDLEADRAAGEHNYLDYYPSPAVAAERLAWIFASARDSLTPLRQGARHRAILAGILAFYLSSPGAAGAATRTIRDRLLASSGPTVRRLTALLRRAGR